MDAHRRPDRSPPSSPSTSSDESDDPHKPPGGGGGGRGGGGRGGGGGGGDRAGATKSDAQSKGKEAQEIKFPKLPVTAAEVCGIKHAVRSIVRAASVILREAWKFIRRVDAKTKTVEEERALEIELDTPPKELETLDAKISAAVDRIALQTWLYWRKRG